MAVSLIPSSIMCYEVQHIDHHLPLLGTALDPLAPPPLLSTPPPMRTTLEVQ